MKRTLARCGALTVVTTGIALVLMATPASAHVTVSSTDATPGGFGTLTFKAPSESESASTTSIKVILPEDAPFAFVSAQAKPGWKVTTTTRKFDEPVKVGDFSLNEALASVTWTSTDGIGPGQFDTFAVSAGPLPSTQNITFKVEQTYSDGEMVSWADPATGTDEPEHPAPTLALAPGTESAAEPAQSSDSVARMLGGAGLVAGLGSLGWAVRENRRRGA